MKKTKAAENPILNPADKRQSEYHEELKRAITSHLELVNPELLTSIYSIVRSLARAGI